jgi:hypothetical protein
MGNARQSAKREYDRKYDLDHRVELRGKARERYRARIPRVKAAALKAASDCPRYEENRGIRNYVICRVQGCGAKAQSVTPAHLRNLHDLSTEQYMSKFPRAPMQSLELREKQRIAMRSCPRRLPRVPGHPGEEPPRPWLFVERAWRGEPHEEILRSLNLRRHPDTLRNRLRGFRLEPPRRHDLGVPVTNAHVLKLLKATGLDSRRFGETFGVSSTSVAEFLRPRSARYRVASAKAQAIIAARDRLIREISEIARTAGYRWGPRSARILRSMVPDFPSICRTLREGLKLTRGFLLENPGSSITDWQDWLCKEVRKEIEIGARAQTFSAFLPLAAELSQFIEPHLGALRDSLRVKPVAIQILAARFGVTASCCVHAERAHALPPLDVQNWILRTRLWQSSVPVPPEKGHAGRPRTVVQIDYGEARELRNRTGLSWWEIAKRLDPVNYAKGGKSRRAAADRLRVGVSRLTPGPGSAAVSLLVGDK